MQHEAIVHAKVNLVSGCRLYTALQNTFPLLQEAYQWKGSQVSPMPAVICCSVLLLGCCKGSEFEAHVPLACQASHGRPKV